MFQAIFYNLADSNKLIDAFIAGTYKSFLTITEATLLNISTEETHQRTIEQSCHSIIAIFLLFYLVSCILVDLSHPAGNTVICQMNKCHISMSRRYLFYSALDNRIGMNDGWPYGILPDKETQLVVGIETMHESSHKATLAWNIQTLWSILLLYQGIKIFLQFWSYQFISINRNAAVELRITMEAFGTEHKNQIVSALTSAGYRPKLVKFKGTYSEM